MPSSLASHISPVWQQISFPSSSVVGPRQPSRRSPRRSLARRCAPIHRRKSALSANMPNRILRITCLVPSLHITSDVSDYSKFRLLDALGGGGGPLSRCGDGFARWRNASLGITYRQCNGDGLEIFQIRCANDQVERKYLCFAGWYGIDQDIPEDSHCDCNTTFVL